MGRTLQPCHAAPRRCTPPPARRPAYHAPRPPLPATRGKGGEGGKAGRGEGAAAAWARTCAGMRSRSVHSVTLIGLEYWMLYLLVCVCGVYSSAVRTHTHGGVLHAVVLHMRPAATSATGRQRAAARRRPCSPNGSGRQLRTAQQWRDQRRLSHRAHTGRAAAAATRHGRRPCHVSSERPPLPPTHPPPSRPRP